MKKYRLKNDSSKQKGAIYLFNNDYCDWGGVILLDDNRDDSIGVVRVEIENNEVVIHPEDIGIVEFDFITDPVRSRYLYSASDVLLKDLNSVLDSLFKTNHIEFDEEGFPEQEN